MRSNSIVAVLVCNIALAILFGIEDRGKGEAFGAGEDMSVASDVEKQRKLRVDAGNSPMPDKGYDFWHGEGSLIDPVKNSLDSVLAELCQTYAKSDARARASMRGSIKTESQDNNALDRALKTIQAGANVFARLRPGEHPNHDSQMFVVFLVEVSDESASQVLVDLSKRKSAGYSLLGVKEGRLFCLAVARSFVAGVSSFETTETLSRFSKGIGDILRRYAGKG